MAEELTFSIGADRHVTVRSYDELERWIQKERNRWAWLVRGDGRTDRLGIADRIQTVWDQVTQQISAAKSQGQPLEYAHQLLPPLAAPPILISTSENGSAVLDILHSQGDLAASFAAGFIQKQLNLQNAQFSEDLIGALLTVVPNLIKPVEWGVQLRNERANYKMAAREILERVDREADERQRENAALVRRAAVVARRIFARKRDGWRRAQAKWQDGADRALKNYNELASGAISSITATERAYMEFMRLKAPVEYWEEKARNHSSKEVSIRRWLYAYFPITVLLLTFVFTMCGHFLLSHPDTANSKASIAFYFVVSGGLLLASTLAFWIGRLLTKLYLSEHHLKNDAEERATMTTTYLALTSEDAASEADRQIILGALFRATPDGIVKDDGPGDGSLQGLLTKFLTK
jgi:hypothetical protein